MYDSDDDSDEAIDSNDQPNEAVDRSLEANDPVNSFNAVDELEEEIVAIFNIDKVGTRVLNDTENIDACAGFKIVKVNC